MAEQFVDSLHAFLLLIGAVAVIVASGHVLNMIADAFRAWRRK